MILSWVLSNSHKEQPFLKATGAVFVSEASPPPQYHFFLDFSADFSQVCSSPQTLVSTDGTMLKVRYIDTVN